jgi:hypothetical protein
MAEVPTCPGCIWQREVLSSTTPRGGGIAGAAIRSALLGLHRTRGPPIVARAPGGTRPRVLGAGASG